MRYPEWLVLWIGKQVRKKSSNKFLSGKFFTLLYLGWPSNIIAYWLGRHGGTVKMVHWF